MPRDTQIFSGASRDGNSDYTLPGNSEISVRAVTATFTDNGAGADWCPAVVMISDSGHIIARALLPDVKVTAGDDAEVSWFPGVKPGGAAAVVGSTVFARAWNDQFSGDAAQVVNAGATVTAAFAHTETTNSAVVDFRTSSHTNDTVDLLAHGTYLLYVGSHWDVVDDGVTSLIYNPGSGENAFPHLPLNSTTNPASGDGIGTAQSQDFAARHITGAAGSENVLLGNRLAAAHSVNQCYFVIVYLPTG